MTLRFDTILNTMESHLSLSGGNLSSHIEDRCFLKMRGLSRKFCDRSLTSKTEIKAQVVSKNLLLSSYSDDVLWP